MNVFSIIYFVLVACFIYIVTYKASLLYTFLYIKDPKKPEFPSCFSIFLIISVKNESQRLENVLNSTQTDGFLRSNSQVIVVDDHSTNEESERMRKICSEYDNVRYLLSNVQAGKKHAIRYAISSFPNDFYAFTDADCILGNHWYKRMSCAFEKGDFILGYAPFMKRKGWLNSLQRYECMWIAFQYFSYAKRGIPYMAVGRNMGASAQSLKSAVPRMKGDHLISGDDDMLVQALLNDTRFSYLLDHSSFAYSEAEDTYGKYLRQKRRQITTSWHYKLLHKILLGGISSTLILFYILNLLFAFYYPVVSLLFIGIMSIFNLLIFWLPSQKLKELDLRWKVIYIEVVYVFHLIILAGFSFFSKNNKWK